MVGGNIRIYGVIEVLSLNQNQFMVHPATRLGVLLLQFNACDFCYAALYARTMPCVKRALHYGSLELERHQIALFGIQVQTDVTLGCIPPLLRTVSTKEKLMAGCARFLRAFCSRQVVVRVANW